MNRYEADIGLGGRVVRLVTADAKKYPSESAIQVRTRTGIEISFSGLNISRNPFIGIESVLGLVDRGQFPLELFDLCMCTLAHQD